MLLFSFKGDIKMKYIESKNGVNSVYLNNEIVFSSKCFREAINFMKGLK